MNELKLEFYWDELPTNKENAFDYSVLCSMWNKNERDVRQILHNLSLYDDGSDFVLIRSVKGNGFYKTDNKEEIKDYCKECKRRAKSIFATLRKARKVLRTDLTQFNFENNLRLIRTEKGLSLSQVVKKMREIDDKFDMSMLSKMENDRCLLTHIQLAKLSEIYGCNPNDLVKTDFYFV